MNPTLNPQEIPLAHTPGPWHVAESENAAVYNGEKHWAVLPNPETTHGQLIADLETLDEAEANACLIAAAPDLLEAAKEALMILSEIQCDLEDDKGEDRCIGLLHGAITKAEGR